MTLYQELIYIDATLGVADMRLNQPLRADTPITTPTCSAWSNQTFRWGNARERTWRRGRSPGVEPRRRPDSKL